jgi:hypothetical protein
MAIWTCPDCNRDFGAVGRSHTCIPGLSLGEFVAASPPFVGPVLFRVRDHLVAVDAAKGDRDVGGGLIIDPLAKKVKFKNGPTFCVLDVKTKWVAVGFSLRRKIESGRMSRKTLDYGDKFFHVVNVDDSDLIDEEFEGWLTEAYHHGTSAKPSFHDPMVPDDIDFELG